MGGAEVQRQDSIPSCHSGLFAASAKKPNTSAASRLTSRAADSSIDVNLSDIVGAMDTNPEVEAWFDEYEHPAKDAMLRVREIILEDDRVTETIKWKSPTFMYKGNMASFNPRTKAHISLMFHTGASIPGRHPLLEGGGETARYARFLDLGDVESKADELRRLVSAWCDSR